MKDAQALEIYKKVEGLLDGLNNAFVLLSQLAGDADIGGALDALGAIDQATSTLYEQVEAKNSKIASLETELEHLEEIA